MRLLAGRIFLQRANSGGAIILLLEQARKVQVGKATMGITCPARMVVLDFDATRQERGDLGIAVHHTKNQHSFASWIFQLFLAFFTPTIGWILLDAFLGLRDSVASDILGYALIGAESVAMAFAVSILFRKSVVEGRLVWLLPVAVELIGIGSDILRGGLPSARGDLLSSGPGRGEENWLLVILTWPTWGCCAYSATVWRLNRMPRRDSTTCVPCPQE